MKKGREKREHGAGYSLLCGEEEREEEVDVREVGGRVETMRRDAVTGAPERFGVVRCRSWRSDAGVS